MSDTVQRRESEDALAKIIIDALACREAGGDCDDVLNRCDMLSAQTSFIDVKGKTEKVQEALLSDLLEDAINGLTKILSDLASSADILSDATAIADKGEKDLLIPSLSITTTQMLNTMMRMQKAIASVEGSLAGVEKLKDVPAATKKVVDALKELNQSLSA